MRTWTSVNMWVHGKTVVLSVSVCLPSFLFLPSFLPSFLSFFLSFSLSLFLSFSLSSCCCCCCCLRQGFSV
ncbi:rCG40903 [Rattus norvegicus]|uniref:RCG40903 n=1 Tax=Rattus norvegicus TaxID=10116 RepID=A6KL16_RAT|nr:rCG40903 [Rattus norvegicus]